MGTRYYQPDIGRWLTRDGYPGEQEQPQTQNKYIYVENNPLNKIDSTGLWGDTVHKEMTYQVANMYMLPVYARMVAQGSFDMDNSQNWAGANWPNNLKYHFDDLKGSLSKRFKKTRKTAIYFLKKGDKNKSYWWLGMGLHSLQDSYSHPKGNMGIVMHGTESGIGMLGKSKAGWFFPVAKWYSIHGSIYDEPRNNQTNFVKALQRTDREMQAFQRYAARY